MSGDNLYRIGKRFGMDYREIMAANRLRKTTIYPNQVLIIPSKNNAPTPIAQKQPVRSSSPRVVSPPVPSSNVYANEVPIGNSGSYSSATVPRDPVKPFVSAKKLPPAPPVASEEDPLGLGYNPSPYQNPPAQKANPAPPIRQIQTPVSPQVPQVAKAPQIKKFPRSREVPAVAHYPGKSKSDYSLDPKHFPMPSFKNPCKPCPTKSSSRSTSSSSRTYTVKSGDSVWSISRKFGVAPLKLRQTNKIMFSRLRPGMSLKIPASSGIWAL